MNKLNAETIKQFCEHVESGLTDKDSAILIDIHPCTISKYLAEGKELTDTDADITTLSDGQIYRMQLYQGYKKASVVVKSKHIKNVLLAGEKQWQASAWWLERKYKDEYGRGVIESEGDEDREITLKLVKPQASDKERLEKLEKDLFKSDS